MIRDLSGCRWAKTQVLSPRIKYTRHAEHYFRLHEDNSLVGLTLKCWIEIQAIIISPPPPPPPMPNNQHKCMDHGICHVLWSVKYYGYSPVYNNHELNYMDVKIVSFLLEIRVPTKCILSAQLSISKKLICLIQYLQFSSRISWCNSGDSSACALSSLVDVWEDPVRYTLTVTFPSSSVFAAALIIITFSAEHQQDEKVDWVEVGQDVSETWNANNSQWMANTSMKAPKIK